MDALYCPRCRYLLIHGTTEAWESCLMCRLAPNWSQRSHYEGEPKTRYPDRDRLKRRIRFVRFIAGVCGVEASHN